MNLGSYQILKIDRKTNVGLFLTDGESDILLPNKYVPETYEIGDEIEVFVYLDHEERPVATTLKPYIILYDFAFLRVNHTNKFGAFLDWGLEKDLFVPFKEQARKMETGKRYLVYMYLDEKTNRLIATSRINKFLNLEPAEYEVGQKVDIIISHITDLGVNVIVNKSHKGLVYKNDIFDEKIRPGDKTIGYIKAIRAENKIDVSLRKTGFEKTDEYAGKILEMLQNGKGFLSLHDKSNPEDIKNLLQMSKKDFKKAIGNLYRQKLIDIQENGIKLL
ncbi:MAG: S1-like domain-containing RNA-binding protein [Flavobacteriaceae bacterium]|jgi:predicted RNA-binding protein (virulence factor B family)|nr:S1-like domain-containing RNA-binding protein [Flavobacteriaceae bacterium]